VGVDPRNSAMVELLLAVLGGAAIGTVLAYAMNNE
jgi:hypothetical protein